uniref:Uncharacterized protein n=1 Tax=Arundo donax TaxID=35708 RepID=A0A0A9AUI9_ARUDO
MELSGLQMNLVFLFHIQLYMLNS